MSLPKQMPRAEYSRKADRDARDAMALTLRRHIERLTFAGSQAQRFEEVFDEWPSFLETEICPSACVLPGEFRYGDSNMTPRLLEDTWEPKGMPGWALLKTAEIQADFQLAVRTNLIAERAIIMRAVEDGFQDGLVQRYGIVLPMPEYYGLSARFALTGGSVIDNEETAMREKRDAAFTISVYAPKVQVMPVWPMSLSVTKTTVDSEGDVISSSTFVAP